MTNDDVDRGDMAHPELSDEQLAALLEGASDAPAGHPVADALLRARRQLDAEPVPTPGAALSEFLGVGRVNEPIPPSVPGIDVLDVATQAEPTPRRIPVLTSLSAFVGTLTGKFLVTTSVAAASLGGAHAVGVVDVPGLPEVDPPSVTEIGEDSESDDTEPDDSESDDSESTSSVPTSTVPTSTVPTSTVPTSTAPTSTAPTSTAPTSTTSTVPTSTTSVAPTGSLTKAYTVAGVGTTTVTVTNGQIALVSAVPAAGWTLDEAGPDQDGVDSKYTQGDLETRIDFEIEDGQLRVRVREENDATDERTERFEYFPL